jgi:uncharacterized protein (TIGR03000 family)
VSTATAPNAATVVIKAANDVVVTVNDQVTTRRSTEETFRTPELEQGRTYSYTVKAEATRDGKKVSETKRVTVRAGQRSDVDFTALGNDQGDVARVTVLGPGAARLTVNDVELGTVESRRSFETPRLESGRRYYYTIKAEVSDAGQPRVATQRVYVEAGKNVTVDFRELTSAARAAAE